jgi:hypothetical protein
MVETKYSFWKGVKKAVLSVILVGAPIVISALPAQWMDITLGGLLVLVVNFIKVKYVK